MIANPDQADGNEDGIGDACTFEANTPVGTGVAVDLGGYVEVTYDNVITEGITEMTMTADGPEGPSSYAIMPSSMPIYYNITTTAGYSGSVEVCIHYDDTEMSPEEEEALEMLHYDGMDWVDVTSSLDTDNNIICGITTALSPFIMGVRSSCCGLYTGGLTGNTNCDADGKRNLADITQLITRVYLTPEVPLCCEENGDTNGTPPINLADITKLIDYVYISHLETAECP
jgi:hypothetical protein